jgi:hypothetical protein
MDTVEGLVLTPHIMLIIDMKDIASFGPVRTELMMGHPIHAASIA